MTANELTPLFVSKQLKNEVVIQSKWRLYAGPSIFVFSGILFFVVLLSTVNYSNKPPLGRETAVWSSDVGPFSTVDPRHIGFKGISRSASSMPRPILRRLQDAKRPLPTNSWCENLVSCIMISLEMLLIVNTVVRTHFD